MAPRIQQAFNAYLTQRWPRPILLAVGVVYLLVMGFELSRPAAYAHLSTLIFLVGFPAMGTAFWVTSTAKWQFVHPRAQLVPGFSGPHLAAAAAWLAVGFIAYPLSLGLVLTTSVPAMLAYALAVGASQTWAVHANRGTLTLLSLALFLAPLAPQSAFFFTDHAPHVSALRGGIIAASLLAVAAWLWYLPRLTEESDDYFIPAHAQSGKASRMEKSEARRNLARHLSRSGFFLWVTDRWHDRLIRHQASSTTQRQRLLRYGFGAVPIAVLCLGVLLGLLLFTGFNAAISGRTNLVTLAGIPGVMALFLGAGVVSARLAMRRTRMQTELLLPLSRADWVNGLFRACARDNVAITTVAGGALLTATLLVQAPPAVTTGQVVTFAAAVLAALVATFATSMQAGLITSGLKRTLVLMLNLYAVLSAGGGCVGLSFWVGPLFGLPLAVVLLAVGLLLLRRAHRNWLNAELG